MKKIIIKLKYLSLFTTFFFMIFISVLLMNRQGYSIVRDPISAIGNLTENFPIFFLGSAITFLLFTYVVYKIYQRDEIKVGWEVFSVPILGISSVLVPFRDHLPILKNVHNLLVILSAVVILRMIAIYNKKIKYKRKYHYFSRHIPEIGFFGTLILYLLTGLNTIIELFYIVIIFYWINYVTYND